MSENPFTLFNLSPLDGRYASKTRELCGYFSEAALIAYRIRIEVEWLIFLCNDLKLKNTHRLKKAEAKKLRKLYTEFNLQQATKIKEIEKITNHDVKAVEYFIKEKMKRTSLKDLTEFVHFACTSEDITNLAYALMIKEGIGDRILPALLDLTDELKKQTTTYKDISMLSRTHGQPASPTTMGKELLNYVARLERQIENPSGLDFLGKINGAVGNYNAHHVAYPEINWIEASEEFVMSLGLTPNLHTTQIEPHDYLAEIFDCFRRINTILIDLDRDIWTYISLNYFKQKVKKGEVGSSTMPHKVNPIDFENSEGNLGMANAIFSFLSEKLPISRMQRDLSDSTVERNIGTAFGHCLIAYKSALKGLSKLKINKEVIQKDLDENWGVLAEAIQTVMRKHKIPKPYEKLKKLTRGKKIGHEEIKKFIEKLKIPEEDKKTLAKLKPETYIGLAKKLIKKY